MNQIRAPFPWFGGKGEKNVRQWILDSLPPHKYYVEPFGGGGNILLAKPRCKNEVYNDVNRAVVNFFRVISDPDYFPIFQKRVSLLPYSRVLFEEFVRSWPHFKDPMEQAIRWFYAQQLNFGGKDNENSASFGIGRTSARVHAFLANIENLAEVHARMQQVLIECCDWRGCLHRFQGEGWLAYCDPPYVLGTRRSGGYVHELQDDDHAELIETLLHYDGAVVLSGYDSPLYSPLDSAGWDKQYLEVCVNVSKLSGKGARLLPKNRRQECLWRNPEAMKRIREAKS